MPHVRTNGHKYSHGAGRGSTQPRDTLEQAIRAIPGTLLSKITRPRAHLPFVAVSAPNSNFELSPLAAPPRNDRRVTNPKLGPKVFLDCLVDFFRVCSLTKRKDSPTSLLSELPENPPFTHKPWRELDPNRIERHVGTLSSHHGFAKCMVTTRIGPIG